MSLPIDHPASLLSFVQGNCACHRRVYWSRPNPEESRSY